MRGRRESAASGLGRTSCGLVCLERVYQATLVDVCGPFLRYGRVPRPAFDGRRKLVCLARVCVLRVAR